MPNKKLLTSRYWFIDSNIFETTFCVRVIYFVKFKQKLINSTSDRLLFDWSDHTKNTDLVQWIRAILLRWMKLGSLALIQSQNVRTEVRYKGSCDYSRTKFIASVFDWLFSTWTVCRYYVKLISVRVRIKERINWDEVCHSIRTTLRLSRAVCYNSGFCTMIKFKKLSLVICAIYLIKYHGFH